VSVEQVTTEHGLTVTPQPTVRQEMAEASYTLAQQHLPIVVRSQQMAQMEIMDGVITAPLVASKFVEEAEVEAQEEVFILPVQPLLSVQTP
jgi:urease accessory protein UreE